MQTHVQYTYTPKLQNNWLLNLYYIVTGRENPPLPCTWEYELMAYWVRYVYNYIYCRRHRRVTPQVYTIYPIQASNVHVCLESCTCIVPFYLFWCRV